MAGFRIRRGDQVVVLTGRDRGRKGEVVRVLRTQERVVVRGVRMVKRHTRPSQGSPGGIVEKEAPIHASNVALVDTETGKATRIGIEHDRDGNRERIARRSGKRIG